MNWVKRACWSLICVALKALSWITRLNRQRQTKHINFRVKVVFISLRSLSISLLVISHFVFMSLCCPWSLSPGLAFHFCCLPLLLLDRHVEAEQPPMWRVWGNTPMPSGHHSFWDTPVRLSGLEGRFASSGWGTDPGFWVPWAVSAPLWCGTEPYPPVFKQGCPLWRRAGLLSRKVPDLFRASTCSSSTYKPPSTVHQSFFCVFDPT